MQNGRWVPDHSEGSAGTVRRRLESSHVQLACAFALALRSARSRGGGAGLFRACCFLGGADGVGDAGSGDEDVGTCSVEGVGGEDEDVAGKANAAKGPGRGGDDDRDAGGDGGRAGGRGASRRSSGTLVRDGEEGDDVEAESVLARGRGQRGAGASSSSDSQASSSSLSFWSSAI